MNCDQVSVCVSELYNILFVLTEVWAIPDARITDKAVTVLATH
jgi:hypothetical protein